MGLGAHHVVEHLLLERLHENPPGERAPDGLAELSESDDFVVGHGSFCLKSGFGGGLITGRAGHGAHCHGKHHSPSVDARRVCWRQGGALLGVERNWCSTGVGGNLLLSHVGRWDVLMFNS
jgi:hypothetical protein